MRLVGINIPDNKRIEIALTYVYGVGRFSANKILVSAKIDPNKRAKDLTPQETSRIREKGIPKCFASAFAIAWLALPSSGCSFTDTAKCAASICLMSDFFAPGFAVTKIFIREICF